MTDLDKKLILGVDADTSAFEKKFSDLEKKIKNMRQFGTGGATSQLADQYRAGGQEDRAKRLEEFRERQASQARKELSRDLKDQEEQLDILLQREKTISDILKNKIDDEKTLLELKKKQKELQEDINRSTAVVGNTRKAISQLEIPNCPSGTRYNPVTKTCEPISNNTGSAGGGFGGLNKLQNLSSLIGIIAGTGMDAYDLVNRRMPMARDRRQSSLSEELYAETRRGIRGDSFNDLAFSQERTAAFKDSVGFFDRQKGYNRGSNLAKGIGGAVLMAAGLAGTVMSGGLLAPLMMAGGYNLMSSDDGLPLEAMLGNMGEVDKKTGQEMMKMFKGRVAANQTKDIRKTILKEFVGENFDTLLNQRRVSGMSEEDYMRDFVRGRGNAFADQFGFSDRVNAANTIMGAGGSTQAAFGNNYITALQAQRNLGMSNAGQAMGRLSSYMSAKESDEAFTRILSKAFTNGLDDSKKLDDYFGAVTSIAANIAGGEDLVSNTIAAALGGTEGIANASRRDVQAAGENFGFINDIFSNRDPASKAALSRRVMQNKMFKNISVGQRLGILDMDYTDINEDNAQIDFLYSQYKKGQQNIGEKSVSKEDFIKEMQEMFRKSILDPVRETKIGKEFIQALDDFRNEKDPDRRRELQGQMQGLMGLMFGTGQGGFKRKMQFINALGFSGQDMGGDVLEKQRQELESLRYNKKAGNLTPKEEQRLKELQEKVGKADFTKAPEGGLEAMKIAQAQIQADNLNLTTKEGGLKLEGVLQEMANGMRDSLKDAGVRQRLFEGMQSALTDGTESVMTMWRDAVAKELGIKVDTGRQFVGDTPTGNTRADTARANMAANFSVKKKKSTINPSGTGTK